MWRKLSGWLKCSLNHWMGVSSSGSMPWIITWNLFGSSGMSVRERKGHNWALREVLFKSRQKKKEKSYVLWYMLKLVTQWRFLVNGLTHNRSPKVQKLCRSNHVGLTTQLLMMKCRWWSNFSINQFDNQCQIIAVNNMATENKVFLYLQIFHSIAGSLLCHTPRFHHLLFSWQTKRHRMKSACTVYGMKDIL